LLHGNAPAGQIGFNEEEMARTPHLKIKLIRVRPDCGPQDLTSKGKLSHNLARLSEVALYLKHRGSNLALISRLFSVIPEFRKGPRRMVQDEAAEGKQPREEEQKQPDIKMQFAIPMLESGPDWSDMRRLAGSRWFSG
jgi:hypothetical protein